MALKKWTLLLAMAMVMVVIFSGCAKNSDSTTSSPNTSSDKTPAQKEKKEVEISVVHFNVYTEKEYQELIDLYNSEHPGVTVKQQVIGGDADINTYLKTQFASGKGPNIMGIDLSALRSYKEVLADLSDQPWVGHVFPVALQGVKADGKIFGMPNYIQGYGLTYNKEIFAKLGIEPPKTITDLRVAAEKIKDSGVTPFATPFGSSWVLGIHGINVAFARQPDPVQFINDLNSGAAKFTGNQQFLEYQQILDTMIKYGSESPLTTDFSMGNTMFANGKAAILHQGNWVEKPLLEINAQLDFGLMPYSVNDNAEENDKILVGVPFYWAVNKNAEGVEEAKDFLNWLVTNETAKRYTSEKLFQIPALDNIEAPSLPALSQDILRYSKEGKTLPWMFSEWPAGISDEFGNILQAYVGKQYSYEVMLEEMQKAWDRLKK